MSGWCPFAEYVPSPNFYPGHDGLRVTAAVIHVVQGSGQSAVNEFRFGRRGVSAHFVVFPDGRLVQCVSIQDSAYANGLTWSAQLGTWIDPEGQRVQPTWTGLQRGRNPNLHTISIEHGGLSGQPWTPAMFDTSARLLRWIGQQTGLVWTPRQTLIGHYEISPISRAHCPGPTVEWERLAAAGNGASAPAITRMRVINPCSTDPADNFAAVRQGPGVNPKTRQVYPVALGGTARLEPGAIVEIDQVRADGWVHLASGLGFVSLTLLERLP